MQLAGVKYPTYVQEAHNVPSMSLAYPHTEHLDLEVVDVPEVLQELLRLSSPKTRIPFYVWPVGGVLKDFSLRTIHLSNKH